jgi:alpha-L-fucosidase 2
MYICNSKTSNAMKIRVLLFTCCLYLSITAFASPFKVVKSNSDLVFPQLATSWDEGIPLGNATIGALIWKHNGALRFSLDRTDLWDLRPVDSLSGPNFRFSWILSHVRNKDYEPIHKKFDWSYDNLPAPSKIPGAALEFSLEKMGNPSQVRLYLNNALCEVKWADGTELQTFVHATQNVGWFVFRNLKTSFVPQLIVPAYNTNNVNSSTGGVSGENQDLKLLGYEQGSVVRNGNEIVYHQKGYKDFYYDVVVKWQQVGTTLYGSWSITSSLSGEHAANLVAQAMKRGLQRDYQSHLNFWNKYWNQSSVSLPDAVLQKQYQNEMYKFGSASREHSYPISLQAVWTADNGKMPPWKGDYHHDLNTQLSYWPSYTGNHLQEELGYINTLWNQRDVYKRYTKEFFGKDGMDIPGVCTLTGEPMGGWVQYSMSQTVSAWLAQHFYLHWKYSADKKFLKEKGYPFVKDVATFLEQISKVDEKGVRRLEISTSPEVYDNSPKSWFPTMTNYDLALMRFIFSASAEMASNLGLAEECQHWQNIGKQLPAFDLDADGALTFAHGFPTDFSHRHFSHAMAIHPLGLINWTDGEKSQHIITATLKKLKMNGPDYWVGYSYSWLGNMKARAFDGEGAAEALRLFAQCFCLKNTFHANGDQSRTGKSKFTYRPFTLEGNFAFASGVQEMLLQSHTGTVYVFPAIPKTWRNVSFDKLRAMGAFLVSATKKEGKITRLQVYSEKGGTLNIVSPVSGKLLKFHTVAGQLIKII